MSYSNVLITGGAGFIGSKLALKLIEKSYNVSILDNLSPQIHGENPEKNSQLFLSIVDKVRFIKGCVTSKDILREAIADNEVIIHLAAETGTGQSMYKIARYSNVNIGATALLLDILANEKHSVKKMVVASSRAIYGEGKYYNQTKGKFVYPLQRTEAFMSKGDFEVKDSDVNDTLELVATTEDAIIHPTSVYGITKQVQEQLVMTVCPTLNIAGVALRYQNVYGPGQSLKNPYTGILSIFSTQIKNGNPINIFEDGKESRDFVYIDDVVDATVLSIEKSEANNQVFNVGTSLATNVLTVANELVSNYKKNVAIVISGNYRLGDIRHNYADIEKIKSLLGFVPKVSFTEGVQKFSKWVDMQEVAEDKYQQSVSEMKAKGLYK